MMKGIKNFYYGRNKVYDITLYSSFFYLFCSFIIGEKDITMTTILFLIFLTSLFFHSYPQNIYFRIADWIASLFLIYYLSKILLVTYLNYAPFFPIFMLLLFLAILGFITSLLAFREKSYLIYNLSHVIWHFSSIILIILVFFNQ